MPRRVSRGSVRRLSISIPEGLAGQLDAMVEDRGFANRSQAVAEMITHEVSRHQAAWGERVMAGTITLFYDGSRRHVRDRLAAIQRAHVDEVISSLHVLLEDEHTMEVLVVQGPAAGLKAIADELVSCKGVKSGGLNLTTAIMPPVHPIGGRRAVREDAR